jgi:hypothetical protein
MVPPFKIPDHIFGRLHAEARKRGMKASSLVRLLIKVIVNRNLFDTILGAGHRIASSKSAELEA